VNHIHYQLALARRDELVREAANHRLAKEEVVPSRFGHSRVRSRRAAPTSLFKGRRAAAQSEG
jgi:hypothetical protein